MQTKIHNSRFFNDIQLKWLMVVITCTLLTACGNDYPKLTHYKVCDEHFNTVLDTYDADKLAALSELFYDRRLVKDVTADLDFKYLFDVTTAQGSERWRCTKNGYCQVRTEGIEAQTEIFYVERYKELFALSMLN